MKRENWWPDEEKEEDLKRNQGGYSIFSTSDISPRTQRYLIRVYGNLAVTTVTASLAILLFMHNLIPEMGVLGTAVCILLTLGTFLSRGYVNDRVRLGMLWTVGFFTGWGAGPLTQTVADLDVDILLMAVLGTFIAFASFSGAALFSQRRSYLYLGSLLSVTSLALMISSLFPSMFNINLYLGLFMFCFYIIYDTQVLVEQAELMRSDDLGVDGALQLFTNLYAIFVRLLIILMKNNPKRKKRKERE